MFLSRRFFSRSLSFCFLMQFFFTLPLFAESKTIVLTLPVVTVGREGVIRAEYNLFQKGTLALEWTEWVGKGERQELGLRDRKENPGNSLLSEGRELGLMFGRYSNPTNMSGFNWGAGAGYRSTKLNWTKTSFNKSTNIQEETNHYRVYANGPSLSARVGYRFVGDSIGFTIGSYIGVKHFLSQLTDASGDDSSTFSPISARDKSVLQQKIATLLKIGIEIGWAF